MGNERNVQQRLCEVEGCGRKHAARGYCHFHYLTLVTGGKTCKVPGCGKGRAARGYCQMHYRRMRKYGDPLSTTLPRLSFSRPEEIKGVLLKRRARVTCRGCWEWECSDPERGYGRITIDSTPHGLHRVSAAVFLGFNVGSDLQVLHRCDNPPCFNPKHLFIGTNLDNIHDKVQKGRVLRGEAHPDSKLTEEDVRAIRARLANGELQVALAIEYGVTQGTVGKIKRRAIWKHVA